MGFSLENFFEELQYYICLTKQQRLDIIEKYVREQMSYAKDCGSI